MQFVNEETQSFTVGLMLTLVTVVTYWDWDW